MNGINKVLIREEKLYKITDIDGNEIGEITESFYPESGKRYYTAARMISRGNYVALVDAYKREKTAIKHLLEYKERRD